MFIFGMVLIFCTLVYMLVSNDDLKSFYLFAITSIAYFIFGYGVSLNEIGSLLQAANITFLIKQLVIVVITFNLIDKFEETVFFSDYRLMMRSFFYRYETITLAIFLLGIIFATNSLFTDFLLIVAVCRLLDVDKFVSYITTNAVLLVNAIFMYTKFDMSAYGLSEDVLNLPRVTNVMIVSIIVGLMLLLYFSGYLVRSLEKDIKIEWRILGIIALAAIVGSLSINVLAAHQILFYLPAFTIILLYLNDLSIHKKFSRYRNFPISVSLVLLISFLGTIYISSYSFIFFLMCSFLVNSIILNERYQLTELAYNHKRSFKDVVLITIFIGFLHILANHSIYNSTDFGVSFTTNRLAILAQNIENLVVRTFELYSFGGYLNVESLQAIPSAVSNSGTIYLLIAIPALSVLSIPTQVLLLNATQYKTKISAEIVVGVIAIGLLIVTLISYGTGV